MTVVRGGERRRILVIGGNGELARDLAACGQDIILAATASVVLARQGSPGCDLALLAAGDAGTQAAAIAELRAGGFTVPIVVIASVDDDEIIALDAGADGFLVQPVEIVEVLARIRALTRGSGDRDPATIEIGPLRIDLAGKAAFVAARKLSLTVKQFALLEVLARRPGRVATRCFLIEQLYDGMDAPSPGTIDVFVHAIRRQLRDSGCTIKTIRRAGFQLIAEAQRSLAVRSCQPRNEGVARAG